MSVLPFGSLRTSRLARDWGRVVVAAELGVSGEERIVEDGEDRIAGIGGGRVGEGT